MLSPTTTPLRVSGESPQLSRAYFLSDVSLDIPNPDTAIFRATLHGPAGSQVWTRAWLSNEIDGTLAETASPPLNAGEVATLTVVLQDNRIPEYAWMRIESAPLATEHVVGIKLPDTLITKK
jgi:hypothetical protein